MYICIYIYIYGMLNTRCAIHMYVIYKDVCIYICVCICIYVYTYICVCICIYVYIRYATHMYVIHMYVCISNDDDWFSYHS